MQASTIPTSAASEGHACQQCASGASIEVDTYKRRWRLCTVCGAAWPIEKQRYLLSFLSFPGSRRDPESDESSIYDYFVHPDNIRYAIQEARRFIDGQVARLGIDVRGKRILDISGGNGHFLNELVKLGASAVLTEFNAKAVEYARRTHGFEAVRFDFNNDRIDAAVRGPFDIILLRAAVMFCADLRRLAAGLRDILGRGGVVLVKDSVVPTLGTLVRVQLDDFSYLALRQPEQVIEAFAQAGLQLAAREDETDPSLYVYDHDWHLAWMVLHYYYEIRGALRLRRHRAFAFPARDRRRATMLFRSTV